MTDLICDLPRDERPRERLFERGAATLSNAELLAILLGSGTRGMNAIQLARELLRDGMQPLLSTGLTRLAQTRGVGPAKAARLAASFELSRRLHHEEPESHPPFDPTAFGTALVRSMSHHRQERLGAAALNARNCILRQREIFVGTINYAVVSTRDLVRFALDENAASVVLFHNHPSGNPEPSADDLTFTIKLREALRLVDITLADHIIAGSHTFHSMRRRGQV